MKLNKTKESLWGGSLGGGSSPIIYSVYDNIGPYKFLQIFYVSRELIGCGAGRKIVAEKIWKARKEVRVNISRMKRRLAKKGIMKYATS